MSSFAAPAGSATTLNADEINHLLWILQWGESIGHEGKGQYHPESRKWTYPQDIAKKLSRMLPNDKIRRVAD